MKQRLLLAGIVVLAIGLRFYRLGEVPHGLAFDEAGITYNAWSIALWHRDEFARFMPLSFQSFGDYKPPFLIYALAAGMLLTGLNLTLIRIYSAVAGVGIVLLTFGITPMLRDKKGWPLLSALFMAISPWAVHFSRVGFEQNVTVLLLLTGIWGLFKGLLRPRYWLMSAVSLAASMYAFHTAKVMVPLLLVAFGVVFFKQVRVRRKAAVLALAVMAAAVVPLVFDGVRGSGAARANTLIIFTASGELASPVAVMEELATNVAHQLSPAFWLSGWDAVSIRHSVPGVGVMYGVSFVLMLIALVVGAARRERLVGGLAVWLVLGLLPALVTHATPHALRSLSAMVPAEMLAAYGFLMMYQWVRARSFWRRVVVGFIALILLSNVWWYLSVYYGRYAKASATAFQYGYREAFAVADRVRDGAATIVVSDSYGQPYVYALLYHRFTPEQFQFGVLSQYQFRPVQWPETRAHTVYIAPPAEIPPNDPAVVGVIRVPNSDQVALVVARL